MVFLAYELVRRKPASERVVVAFTYAGLIFILSLMVFMRIIQVNYDVVSRLRGRLKSATLVVGVGGVVELGLAVVGGARYGLEGLALGWLVGAILSAIVMLPRVLGEAWPTRRDEVPAA